MEIQGLKKNASFRIPALPSPFVYGKGTRSANKLDVVGLPTDDDWDVSRVMLEIAFDGVTCEVSAPFEVARYDFNSTAPKSKLIQQMGGYDMAFMSIGQVYAIIRFHNQGDEDVLCREGSNMFFVWYKYGEQAIIRVMHHRSCWLIGAYTGDYSEQDLHWYKKTQVFGLV